MYVADLLTILISKVPSHHFHVTLVLGSMPPEAAHTQGGDYRRCGPQGVGITGSYCRSYLSPNPFPLLFCYKIFIELLFCTMDHGMYS